MKYYLIAGEASGDLHASHLIKEIRRRDADATFRFFGGDSMAAAAGDRGTLVTHYRQMAYMGIVPVLLHLPAILRAMRRCKSDIMAWQPDSVILVDYAGFNLSIAKYLHRQPHRPRIIYYIAPKLWAWKEYRIRNIRRDVDCLLSILPFEKEFFEQKHHYPMHYVGNPTADEVRRFLATYRESHDDFCLSHGLDPRRPIIALLAGSRRAEIDMNLAAMIESVEGDARFDAYQVVVAGAPGTDRTYYDRHIYGHAVQLVHGATYPLLAHTTAALVTSGTATLETALMGVPQVVCYRMSMPRLARWGFDHILKVRYISLVNLIAGKEVVRELFADRFTIDNIRQSLAVLLPGNVERHFMMEDYHIVERRLGDTSAPATAADIVVGG